MTTYCMAVTESTDRTLSNLAGLRRAVWPSVTSAEVAREMGMSKSYVSLIERGLRPVSDEVAARYLAALTTCRERARDRLSVA